MRSTRADRVFAAVAAVALLSARGTAAAAGLTLTVTPATREGRWQVQSTGKALGPTALREALRAAGKGGTGEPLSLMADRTCTFGQLMYLLDTARLEGFRNVSFRTPGDERGDLSFLLPTAEELARAGAGGWTVAIAIDRGGDSQIDGRPAAPDDIRKALRPTPGKPAAAPVRIEADQALAWAHVAYVLDLLRREDRRTVVFAPSGAFAVAVPVAGKVEARPIELRRAGGAAAVPPPLTEVLPPDKARWGESSRPVPESRLTRGAPAGAMLCPTSWHVLGPIPLDRRSRTASPLTKVYAPETGVDLDARYTTADGKEIAWRFVMPKEVRVVPPTVSNYATFYAFAEVYSDADRDVWAAFGADDFGRCWINGKLMWSSGSTPQPWIPDRGFAVAKLKKGANQVLFRLDNAGGTTGFSVVFLLGK